MMEQSQLLDIRPCLLLAQGNTWALQNYSVVDVDTQHYAHLQG